MMPNSENEPAVPKLTSRSAEGEPAPTRCAGCMHPVPFWSLILAALVGFGGYAWISEPSDLNVLTFVPTVDDSDPASSVLSIDNKAGVVENCNFFYKTDINGYIIGFIHQCCDGENDEIVSMTIAEVLGGWKSPDVNAGSIGACAISTLAGKPCPLIADKVAKVALTMVHGRDYAFLSGLAGIECLDSEWGQRKCRVDDGDATLAVKDGMAQFTIQYNGDQVASTNFLSPDSAGEQNTFPSAYRDVDILGLSGTWAPAPTCPASVAVESQENELTLLSLVYAV